MDIRRLQRAIVDGLEDVKALDIQVFNTEHLTPLFERVVIASGTSHRQTKALAASVRDKVRSHGFPVPRTEGEDNGEWIIVDCGAAVAHIMQPTMRHYYRLEELWGEKPVHVKLETATKGLPKASEPEEAVAAKKAPAKKASAEKAPTEKAPTRKTTKPVAKKAAVKATPAKKVAAKKAPAKRVVAKKVVAKTAAPKRAVAKKVAVRKVAAKKVTASKTAVRKTAAKSPVRKAARKA